MAKRILVAVDLSASSLEALREAHGRAIATGAALAVCHVLPRQYDLHTLFPHDKEASTQRLAELEAESRRELERSVESAVGAIGVEVFVEHGSEYAEIIRCAEAWSADLVVVGSHGSAGPSRIGLGSVAKRVVRYAHCAVLVVRPAAIGDCVLVATDLSDPSMPAVEAGVEEARRLGHRLVVAQALDLSETAWRAGLGTLFGPTTVLPPVEVQRDLHDALSTTLRQVLERLGATGDVAVLDGSPAAAVIRHAKQVGAGLLVIGTHGRTGLARVALGSVADDIIRAAECSVLAVRLTG